MRSFLCVSVCFLYDGVWIILIYDRIGPSQDALSNIIIITLLVFTIDAAIYIYGHFTTEKKRQFVNVYFESNQFLVGSLLVLWMIGFDIVSYAIYRQFEQTEVYPADDYYVAGGESAKREPQILQLPNQRIAVALDLTRV